MLRQLLVAALAVTVVNSQQPCTSAKFQACQHNLAQGTNINDTNNMFKDYTIMYNQFLNLFSQNPGSTNGMMQVCNNLEVFNSCMFQNRGCFALQNLAQLSNLQNAYLTDGTLAMYQFNCGPGINTLVHEGLACAQRVMSGYSNTLQACVATYVTSITHDNSNGCTYVDNLINCWSAPFSTAPCRRAEAADVWWACEANRVFSLNQFPNCGITCDVKFAPFGSANGASYLEKHHKVVDGEHWYKIPDYKDMVNGKLQLVEGAWMNN